MDLNTNLKEIQERIDKAAKKAGRNPEDITLIGVTKTVDYDVINESIKMGITHIGESKPQEITRKYELVEGNVVWHMIGHLQKNKVKYIIDKVDLYHSLESLSLAGELNKRAESIERDVEVLIQVNVAKEDSKFGIYKEDVHEFIKNLEKYDRIRVTGLMTIAPYTENPEDCRSFFKELKKLSMEIEEKGYKNTEMKHLSMGMTNDFEIAIEEGATMVRVGSGIYGERVYI